MTLDKLEAVLKTFIDSNPLLKQCVDAELRLMAFTREHRIGIVVFMVAVLTIALVAEWYLNRSFEKQRGK